MPLGRAEQERLFTWALQTTRLQRTPSHGGAVDEIGTIQRGFREFSGRIEGLHHSDVVNAVKRAVSAYEIGRQMTAHPEREHAPRAHDLPNKPVADIRRTGRFEYRAVVQGRGPTGRFETLVIVHSREFLSGEEVFEEARRIFWEEVGQEQRYRARIGALNRNIVPDVWIVSATRHQPERRR